LATVIPVAGCWWQAVASSSNPSRLPASKPVCEGWDMKEKIVIRKRGSA
jgi:hypothetical protein